MSRRQESASTLIIVGSGIAGAALSCLLTRYGFQVLLIDQTDPAWTPPPLLLALNPASRQILHQAGIWPLLPSGQIGSFHKIQIWDERGSTLCFDSTETCAPALAWTVELEVLRRGWQNALSSCRPAIRQVTGSVQRISRGPGSIRLELSSGEQFQGTLLIAADGANSAVRRHCRIPCQVRDYRQQALVCSLRGEQPHQHTARQVFLRDGPLALLPGAEPTLYSLVWSTGHTRARRLLKLAPSDFLEELRRTCPKLARPFSHCGPLHAFPLRQQQALRYQAERVVLLGEAAHLLHPMAGLGANLALQDVAALSRELRATRDKKRDPGGRSALRRYERRRRAPNRVTGQVLDALKWLFETQRPPLPQLRGLGLSALDTFAPGRHWIMHQAMGQGYRDQTAQ